ncbi:MAG TPA: VOC family protein [Streptosporangiaceae bacterium]|nr:VOC family protein [Streptosporangiaceae bacterium]
MTTTASLSFAALNFDCADPAVLADFWGKALGRPVSPGAVAGDVAVGVTGPESGPRLIFHPVPTPATVRNMLRPILLTDHHGAETKRLTGLGARPVNEIKLPAVRVTTFADPEGYEFDLVTWQSE